jgi:hypothetical protein
MYRHSTPQPYTEKDQEFQGRRPAQRARTVINEGLSEYYADKLPAQPNVFGLLADPRQYVLAQISLANGHDTSDELSLERRMECGEDFVVTNGVAFHLKPAQRQSLAPTRGSELALGGWESSQFAEDLIDIADKYSLRY